MNKNDAILSADNTLDGKSLSLLGFEVALGLGYISFVLPKLEDLIKYTEGITGLVFLAISSFLLLIITWPKKYISISPDISVHSEYLNKKEKALYFQLISDAQYSFNKNREKVKSKNRFFKDALILLFLSVFLFILSISIKIYV
jgi:hypothetical protein